MVGMMIATALALEGVALFATAFAINFAVSTIVTKMFGVDQQGAQDNGVRQQVPPSNTNAIPIVYGDAYLGGTFVDAVISTNQKAMYYVMAISSISPDGQFTFDQTDMYYGDRKITFDSTDMAKVVSLTDEAGNVDEKINGYLWIGLYTSSQSGVINNINWFPPNVVMGPTTPFTDYPIASSQQWPSTGRQMNGTAFAIVTLIYSQDAGTTALSPITFKVKHTLNGTGVAKPGDVWYDYITNKVYGGAVGWMPDGSFNPDFVDAASATVLNNYSDELITFKNSSGVPSTQPRYRMNGVLDAGQSVITNIDKIMSCCDSWMTYNAALGKWSVVVNKPETAAFSFNDDNIIGEIRVSATDITSSINQVEAKFPFKDNRDQPSFVQLATPENLLYPNEPANKYSITYDLVNESVQASYLANRLLEQAREDLIVSFSTTYYGIQVDAGAVVSVTNTAYGWSGKLFRVMKVNEASLPDGSLGAKLELSEYNAQVYDDKDITAFAPAPNSDIPSVTYFSALSAPTVTGFPAASFPHFDVTVTIPVTGRVTKSNLYYTTVAIPSASDWKLLSTAISSNSQPVTNGSSYVFANQVLGAGTYYFAYNVANDIGQSTLSSMSSSFVWNPIAATGPTGPTGTSGPTGSLGPTGPDGSQVATAYLYQWASAQPGNPSGQSTYTWSPPENSAYTGGNGWQTTIPANPGTPLLRLWVAAKAITALATASTTTVSWTSGFSVYDATANGAAGTQTATPTVYQWAATIPTISGTSTYTWSSGTFTPVPSGWSTAPGTSTPGYTLWAAKVTLVDSATATTSSINWTTASIIASGYAGGNGLSSRVTYARVASNPTPVSGTIVTSGSSSYPSSSQSSSTWGFAATWSASDPDPSSTNSLYQSDGIYDSSTNITTWSTPYISSLKVGQLSAISTNTGSLTISGTMTSNTAAISGTTMTGSGAVIYSSGNFAIGNATNNITYNGSVITMNGQFVSAGSLTSGNMTDGSAGNAWIQMGQNGTVIASLKSALNVRKVAADTSLVNIAAQNNLDGNVTIWGHSANQAIGNGNGISGSHTTANTFNTWQRLGALGSGVVDAGVWGFTYADNTSSKGGVFERYSGTDSSSPGTLNKSIQLATASYCAYSPSGQGKIYIVDGNGPFTGFHEGMFPIATPVEVGDIVTDVSIFYRYNISNVLFNVTSSASANQARAIGVVSNVLPVETGVPGILWEPVQTYKEGDLGPLTTMTLLPQFNLQELQSTYKVVQINAVGEGQINVCGEGGDIQPGDLIVTSSTPGKGMKQSDDVVRSITVAKAREAATFSGPTDIQQIACIYLAG